MSSAIEVVFIARDVENLKAAFGSIEDRCVRMGRNIGQAAERSTSARIAGEKRVATETDKAARDAVRATERAAREQIRIKNAINKLEISDWQRTEREKTRVAEQESRVRQQIAERESRRREALGRATGRQASGAITGVLGTAGRMASIAAAIGGGFTIADSMRSGIQTEAMAGQIVRSAANTGGLTGADVQKAARFSAIANGSTTEEQLAGLDAFIQKTGDLKVAVSMLDDLGKMAAASGSKMEDLGSTAAEVYSQLGDVGATKEVLLTFLGQGKQGAIDIRNLGQYGARLASTAGLFEGNTAENMKTFGALSQVAKAKGGASDAAEATESVFRLFDEVATHQEKFGDLGVRTKGKGGLLRAPTEILLDTLVKSGGDLSIIPKLFGRQAGKVETGLAKAFLEGSGGKTDAASLKAGRTAAEDLIKSFEKPMTMAEVEGDAKKKMLETQSRLNVAMEHFHESINDKLLPLLPQLIDQLERLIPYIAKAAEIFGNFPAETIAVLIGGGIVAEFAKVKLGEYVRDKIADMLGGKRPPSPNDLGNAPMPEGSGGLNIFGKSLPIIGAGIEFGRKAKGLIESGYRGELTGDVTRASSLVEKLTGGNATPEDREEAERRLGSLTRTLTGGKEYKDELSSLPGDVQALFGGASGTARREENKAAAGMIDEIAEAVKRLQTALGNVEGAAATASNTLGSIPKVESGPSARWPPQHL